jgi:hypothetical protein
MGDRIGACRDLVWKPVKKRLLGKHKRRWEENVKMDLLEVGRSSRTGLIWLRIGTVSGLLLMR